MEPNPVSHLSHPRARLETVHDGGNPGCPRNNERNQTICTCADKVYAATESPDQRRKTPHQQRVEDFMCKAGQEVPDAPTVPSEAVRILRAKLVFEEAVRELILEGLAVDIGVIDVYGRQYRFMPENLNNLQFFVSSIRQPNIQLIADGCADTSVVTIGTLSACGIADMELLEEVDRSNLSKFDVPKCNAHNRDMVPASGSIPGKYRCPEVTCGNYDLGPYCSPEGKWVKGPQYSPADIEGVLARQRPAEVVREQACAICGASCLEGLQVCYDHCKLDDNLDPRNPTIAECVDLVKKELADTTIRGTQQAHRYAPNPLGGAPIDLTTFHPPKPPGGGDVAEGVVAAAAVQAKQLKFDSGGITMCPHCRNPLSDEMVKDLKSGKRQQGGCSGCMGTFLYADLFNPRIH